MKYANQISYTDVRPFVVVRAITDKTIEVRALDSERDPSVVLEVSIGGFNAYHINQRQQKWIITENDANPVVRLRLSKRYGWRDANGDKYKLADAPIRFYDYNF
jgi:hypothetical protein